MCMATALLHALQHHLNYSALLEPVQRAQHHNKTSLSAAGDLKYIELCSLARGCCSPLLLAALSRCRLLLMLGAPSDSLPQKDARVDGYEVVGLMSLASSAMRTMLVLPSQAAHPPGALAQVPCFHLLSFVRIPVLGCLERSHTREGIDDRHLPVHASRSRDVMGLTHHRALPWSTHHRDKWMPCA